MCVHGKTIKTISEISRYIATINGGQSVHFKTRRKFNEKCKQDPFDVKGSKTTSVRIHLENGETDRKGRMIGRTDQSASNAQA